MYENGKGYYIFINNKLALWIKEEDIVVSKLENTMEMVYPNDIISNK